MTFSQSIVVALISLFLSVISLPALGDSRVPIDQIPMYGGMDRDSIPELKSADAQLLSSGVELFGSREKASMAWANRGFTLYQQDDLEGAMRRFNQAWLLNPRNPDVYWGFSVVLTDQQKFCEAIKMVEMAWDNGESQPGFLPDAALVYTGCTVVNNNLDNLTREEYLSKSDKLFSQAFASPFVRKEYTLFHWARAMYGRGDYAGAWEKVFQFRSETGREFDAPFIKNLKQKMPEPAQ